LHIKKKEKCYARNRFRRVLTEVKQKALKTIEIINLKGKQNQISYEDFDNGVFPWERFQHEENSEYPTSKNSINWYMKNTHNNQC
jgi:hypothetical protein